MRFLRNRLSWAIQENDSSRGAAALRCTADDIRSILVIIGLEFLRWLSGSLARQTLDSCNLRNVCLA